MDIQQINTLKHCRYRSLKRKGKGLLRQFLGQITVYSRQQVTHLIQQYKKTGRVIRQQQTTNGFTGIYTRKDVELLAAIDTLHDTPSGPMIKNSVNALTDCLAISAINAYRVSPSPTSII